ncbi:MAG TPA: HEAT repeat domain-containing protein [Silvibacterium sp.]|nr:HEAT repeat domain-containing protein [Silvibacterium sp.]
MDETLREQTRRKLVREIAQAIEPLERDLSALGFSLRTFRDVIKSGKRYTEAIPILLAWLPRLPEVAKEEVVRALTVPWAKPLAAPVLIEEFTRASDDSLRWAIGNALDTVADYSVLERMIEIAMDRQFGSARQMVVMALGKFKDFRCEDAALRLLNDEEVAGHAVVALRRLRSMRALSALEVMKSHPKAWVRSEAKKAIAAISKPQKSSLVM